MPLMLGPRGDIKSPLNRLQSVGHTRGFSMKAVGLLALKSALQNSQQPRSWCGLQGHSLGHKGTEVLSGRQ